MATADTNRIEAPVTVRAYLMCAFAAFGGIFFGYDTGWMGSVQGMPYFITQYTGLPKPGPDASDAVKKAFSLASWQKSLTTSILSAGTFFGAIIAGDVADFIGRRLKDDLIFYSQERNWTEKPRRFRNVDAYRWCCTPISSELLVQ